METSLEHVHELEPHIKVARARAGVLMLILSDALAVLAILAAGGYLRTLNTEGQYKVAGDLAPAYLPGLLIAIALVLSGLAYYWWERKVRRPGEASQPLFFLLALVLMLVAGVSETWIGATLRYSTPIQAYESVQLLLPWFTAVPPLFAVFFCPLRCGGSPRGGVGGGWCFG